MLPGSLPDDESERKGAKPDLEALTALPPFGETPYGGLLGLGSGSDDEGNRDRGFFWAFAPDGSLEGEPSVIDLSPLYELLREKLGGLNIEGAAVLGDELWLFHRGNEGDAGNVVAEIALSDLAGSLTGDHDIDVEELKELRQYDLGEMDGVELCFSDATAISDELVCFTASAEGDEDGDIRGSVVGHDLDRRRGPAPADDRPQVEGRGGPRRRGHGRHRLRLRLRSGRRGGRIAAPHRHDAARSRGSSSAPRRALDSLSLSKSPS